MSVRAIVDLLAVAGAPVEENSLSVDYQALGFACQQHLDTRGHRE